MLLYTLDWEIMQRKKYLQQNEHSIYLKTFKINIQNKNKEEK